MSFVKRHVRVLTVAVGCLGLGAGASAIASAGASTTPSTATHAGHRGARAELRRAVHGDVVVYTKQGFKTITFDRGFVQSVHGDVLTLREGTKNATYKTVTLTIPSTARVRNNGQRSTLSTLTSGEHVGVIQGVARTIVIARSATGSAT
jgi:hypothetical protein